MICFCERRKIRGPPVLRHFMYEKGWTQGFFSRSCVIEENITEEIRNPGIRNRQRMRLIL